MLYKVPIVLSYYTHNSKSAYYVKVWGVELPDLPTKSAMSQCRFNKFFIHYQTSSSRHVLVLYNTKLLTVALHLLLRLLCTGVVHPATMRFSNHSSFPFSFLVLVLVVIMVSESFITTDTLVVGVVAAASCSVKSEWTPRATTTFRPSTISAYATATTTTKATTTTTTTTILSTQRVQPRQQQQSHHRHHYHHQRHEMGKSLFLPHLLLQLRGGGDGSDSGDLEGLNNNNNNNNNNMDDDDNNDVDNSTISEETSCSVCYSITPETITTTTSSLPSALVSGKPIQTFLNCVTTTAAFQEK
jgi:hypothetical protein